MNYLLLWLVVFLAAGSSVVDAINSEPGRLGCYEDNAERVFKQWNNIHPKNTVHFCKNLCQDFKFAGLEAGQWCMCGDTVPPKSLPDSKCAIVCTGDPNQTCGGGWALEVFPVEPKPAMIGKPVGCFQDTADRVWDTGIFHLQYNTPQRCINACRGFRYAGVEAGNSCMCGDSLPPTPVANSTCQYQCTGFPGKTCGGHWAMEVFEISEVEEPVTVVGCVPLEYQPNGNLGIYKLYAQRKTWDEAWQHCEDEDAHLVIINSEKEAKFLRSLFAQVPSETRMHAGFHDLLRKGYYRTLFGATLGSAGYNVWSKLHPKVPSPVQHCGALDVKAHLAQIDGNCGAKAVFVCEKKSRSPDAKAGAQQFDVRGALDSQNSTMVTKKP